MLRASFHGVESVTRRTNRERPSFLGMATVQIAVPCPVNKCPLSTSKLAKIY